MWKEITEGKTKLIVPEEGEFGKTEKGRLRKAPVFYNPRMKLNRDICCAVVSALNEKESVIFADILSGSGAKGVRVAKEAGCEVYLNDANRDACSLIERNAALNGLKAKVFNQDANRFMNENYGIFSFIDIDPFGTPIPFLDNAIMTVREGGYLGVTATDVAPLCGVYPKACFRKYGAVPLTKCEFCHEVAMRILIGCVARTCAKYSKAINVLLSYYHEHYLRVYIRVLEGKRKADRALEKMGFLYYCSKCLNRTYEKENVPRQKSCECGEEFEVSGPLWLGELKVNNFCYNVLEHSRYLEDKKLEKFIEVLTGEVEVPFYFDVHAVAKKSGMEVIAMGDIIRGLRDAGHKASRTHFSPTSVKTDADIHVIKSILAGHR